MLVPARLRAHVWHSGVNRERAAHPLRGPPISPEDGARAIAEYLEASDWIGRKATLTANYPALHSLAKAPEPPESPQPDLESRISILFVVLNCCEENGGIEALDGCLPMVLQF